MINYLFVLNNCFPDAQAYVVAPGQPTNYNDLQWITASIDKATLDASYCAADGEGNGLPPGDDVILHAGRVIGLYHGIINAKSGTTTFDLEDDDSLPDNTPSITKGTEIWNCEVTPTSSTSTFKLNFSITIDVSKAATALVAVYRDNELIGVASRYCSGSNKPGSVHIQYVDYPNTTNAVTYSARFGKLQQSSGTWYVNRTRSYDLDNSMEQRFAIMEFE